MLFMIVINFVPNNNLKIKDINARIKSQYFSIFNKI